MLWICSHTHTHTHTFADNEYQRQMHISYAKALTAMDSRWFLANFHHSFGFFFFVVVDVFGIILFRRTHATHDDRLKRQCMSMRLVIRYATVIMFDSVEFQNVAKLIHGARSRPSPFLTIHSRITYKAIFLFVLFFFLLLSRRQFISVNVHSFRLSHSANHNCILNGTTVHRLLPSTRTHTEKLLRIFTSTWKRTNKQTRKIVSKCFFFFLFVFVLVHSVIVHSN